MKEDKVQILENRLSDLEKKVISLKGYSDYNDMELREYIDALAESCDKLFDRVHYLEGKINGMDGTIS